MAGSFDRTIADLNQCDVTTICPSHAPLAQLNAYKQRMGWTFRWGLAAKRCNYGFGVPLLS